MKLIIPTWLITSLWLFRAVPCCLRPAFRNVKAIASSGKLPARQILLNGCLESNDESFTNVTISRGYVPILFRGSVSGMNNLQLLTIENSQTNRVEDGALTSLSSLKYLNLAHNELTEIRTATFKDLPLEALHLDYNRIDQIEKRAFDIASIKMLQLSNNRLTSVEPEWFGGNSTLKYLFLDSNSISHVPANAFANLPKLITLSLRNNGIYGLHKDAFKGGLMLNTLSLSDNRLFSLDGESLQPLVATLRYFYVDRNNLTYLPESFLKDVVDLKMLALELNPWQCSCYRKMRTVIEEKGIYVLPLVDADGTYPVCIDGLDNSQICVEAVDEEIIREFAKNIRQ